ncbi:MAG: hybrid sensor histidine kinase/response regulator [Anaerolineae bacterium]|nr:hybrid sensor histidine kinase/response regulator [Anaerolineae bacterium]
MSEHPSAAVESYSIVELTRSSLLTLSAAGLLTGWLWWVGAAWAAPFAGTEPAQARAVVPPTLLASVCLACLLTGRLPERWRSALLLLGLAATSLLSFAWSGAVAWLYSLPLAVIVAGLLLGTGASFLAALALTASLLGFPLRAPGTSPLTLLPPIGCLWAATLVSWLSSRNLYTALLWALHGQRRAAELVAELRERQGELNRTLVALTEASRRLERTNQELAVARERAEEARAMKEHFVANVSHELRTPLNLIVGFSEMMYLEPESYEGVVWTPELQSDVGELYQASCHLQGLVNDILDLSRIDAARLPMYRELHDLPAIINDALQTVSPLLRQKGVACHVHYPDSLPQLLVDRTRLRQVMLNLLNNAARHTDQGQVEITVSRTDNAVVVSVRDTGAGIPPERLEHVFEEFQPLDEASRRRGGAGLGLALSRQFVQLHGGRMWAESQPGVGSTFFFSLPLPGAVPQTTPLVSTAPHRQPDRDDAPVVVVDADPGIAGMLRRYLGDRPVLPAADPGGAEALVEAEHPLAVIVNLPPDAPSPAWLGAVGHASERYGVPVLRCSIPSPSWLTQATQLDDCLSKPVSRATLAEAIGRLRCQTARVLVVDDNPGFASLIARMLRSGSLAREVLMAYTGSDALRLAREAEPDLVLLDLLLPDMSGFDVLDGLRREPRLRRTRVIAVTATSYAEEALQRRAGHLTLSQSSGLSAGTLAELLSAILAIVRPRYAAGRST